MSEIPAEFDESVLALDKDVYNLEEKTGETPEVFDDSAQPIEPVADKLAQQTGKEVFETLKPAVVRATLAACELDSRELVDTEAKGYLTRLQLAGHSSSTTAKLATVCKITLFSVVMIVRCTAGPSDRDAQVLVQKPISCCSCCLSDHGNLLQATTVCERHALDN